MTSTTTTTQFRKSALKKPKVQFELFGEEDNDRWNRWASTTGFSIAKTPTLASPTTRSLFGGTGWRSKGSLSSFSWNDHSDFSNGYLSFSRNSARNMTSRDPYSRGDTIHHSSWLTDDVPSPYFPAPRETSTRLIESHCESLPSYSEATGTKPRLRIGTLSRPDYSTHPSVKSLCKVFSALNDEADYSTKSEMHAVQAFQTLEKYGAWDGAVKTSYGYATDRAWNPRWVGEVNDWLSDQQSELEYYEKRHEARQRTEETAEEELSSGSSCLATKSSMSSDSVSLSTRLKDLVSQIDRELTRYERKKEAQRRRESETNTRHVSFEPVSRPRY